MEEKRKKDEEKNLNKNKLLKIIVCLVFFLIILIIVLIACQFTGPIGEKKANLNYINSEEWNSETFPKGMPKFFREYEGNLTAQNIGKSIYYVTTKVIPDYYREVKVFSDEELKKYFNSNKKIIALDLGIEEVEDFIDLAKEIKKIKVDNFEIESFYIDEENIRPGTTKTKGDLYIKYKDNEEIMIKIDVVNDVKKGISSIRYYK